MTLMETRRANILKGDWRDVIRISTQHLLICPGPNRPPPPAPLMSLAKLYLAGRNRGVGLPVTRYCMKIGPIATSSVLIFAHHW